VVNLLRIFVFVYEIMPYLRSGGRYYCDDVA